MFNVNRGSDDQRSLSFRRFEDAEAAARDMSEASPLKIAYVQVALPQQWLATYVDGRLKRCDLSAIADAMAVQ